MGTIAVRWLESQLMTGVDSYGHPLVIGSWPERDPEWAGLKPSDLLLLSAASCSAYDVVLILNKQRQPLKGLLVECTGEQAPEPPHAFTRIHLHYVVQGECDMSRVSRAIELSEEKYCSVINSLKPQVEFTSSFDLQS